MHPKTQIAVHPYLPKTVHCYLPTTTQYLDWIRHNISAAWSHRDANRTLMYRDYSVTCPTGNIQSYEASSGVAFMQLFNR